MLELIYSVYFYTLFVIYIKNKQILNFKAILSLVAQQSWRKIFNKESIFTNKCMFVWLNTICWLKFAF